MLFEPGGRGAGDERGQLGLGPLQSLYSYMQMKWPKWHFAGHLRHGNLDSWSSWNELLGPCL